MGHNRVGLFAIILGMTISGIHGADNTVNICKFVSMFSLYIVFEINAVRSFFCQEPN